MRKIHTFNGAPFRLTWPKINFPCDFPLWFSHVFNFPMLFSFLGCFWGVVVFSPSRQSFTKIHWIFLVSSYFHLWLVEMKCLYVRPLFYTPSISIHKMKPLLFKLPWFILTNFQHQRPRGKLNQIVLFIPLVQLVFLIMSNSHTCFFDMFSKGDYNVHVVCS